MRHLANAQYWDRPAGGNTGRLFLAFGGPVCADRFSNCSLDRVLTYKNLIYLLNLQFCGFLQRTNFSWQIHHIKTPQKSYLHMGRSMHSLLLTSSSLANAVSSKSLVRYRFPVFTYLPANTVSGYRLGEINNLMEETYNMLASTQKLSRIDHR